MKSTILSTLLLAHSTFAIVYSTWLADSAIARGQGNGLSSTGAPIVSYEHGTFQRALTAVYTKTSNQTYFNYIQSAIDRVVTSNGTIQSYTLTQYTLDSLRLGETFVQLATLTNATKYKTAAQTFRKQLETHPRNKAGGFWHKQIYPFQMWGDGQYMALPFYASFTSTYQSTNTSAWSDIALQISLYHTNCLQSSTNLLFHGYDESKKAVWSLNSPTDASPEVWDRAVGWYAMALVDLLDYIPTSHPSQSTILSTFQQLAPALVASADPTTHVWWLVISEPGRTGNYFETSGSSMFIYALLKGVRKGYITGSQYTNAAKSAYDYIAKTFVTSGSDGLANFANTVSVGSLSGNGSSNTISPKLSIPMTSKALQLSSSPV